MSNNYNIEIKAHCSDHDNIRNILQSIHAEYKGLDHQIDTYFNVQHGRLKMRQGNIESALIQYSRNNQAGPKQSNYRLFKSDQLSVLKQVLEDSIGTKVIIDKQREIYYIKNAKFHLDQVKGLGQFIEIEIIQQHKNNDPSFKSLQDQCNYYMDALGIKPNDLIAHSYSDLLMENPGG